MSESRDQPDDDTTPDDDDTAGEEKSAEQTKDAASDDPYDIESDFGPDGNPVNSAE